MKTPPFCPNQDCKYHQTAPAGSTWFVRHGRFQSAARGAIQRYRCKACGRHFSSQTFSLDYMTQRTISYRKIFELLHTASGIRDIARILKASPHCITDRISRLARQALAVHADLLDSLELKEDLVADGFESFAVSQYFPNNIQLLAGKESQYWIFSDYAHLRRKGRMTAYQKKRNTILQAKFIYDRVTIYKSFEELVRQALFLKEKTPHTTTALFTDEHRQYRKVMMNLSDGERSVLQHRTCSSKRARSLTNPLFSVNYLDREIRKDLAEHTRESMQFARNVVNQMERLAIYRLYHNYWKPYRINGQNEYMRTHAEEAGICSELIQREMKTFFTQRRFLSRVRGMMSRDRCVWLKNVATPLKRGVDYLPEYSWA